MTDKIDNTEVLTKEVIKSCEKIIPLVIDEIQSAIDKHELYKTKQSIDYACNILMNIVTSVIMCGNSTEANSDILNFIGDSLKRIAKNKDIEVVNGKLKELESKIVIN